MRLRTFCGLILTSSLMLTACGDLRQPEGDDGSTKPQSSGKRYIEVLAEADANRQQATYLDIIFVYGKDVEERLPATAERWFMLRDALMRVASTKMDIVSHEVPASFALGPIELPKRANEALRVVAYASYADAAGQAMIDLTQQRQVELRLGPKAVALKPR